MSQTTTAAGRTAKIIPFPQKASELKAIEEQARSKFLERFGRPCSDDLARQIARAIASAPPIKR